MTTAIAIIAKDEAKSIGHILAQIRDQTTVSGNDRTHLVLLANGCTDNTAGLGQAILARDFADLPNFSFQVFDTPIGGKSRSWNTLVHELLPDDTKHVIFLDADIELIGTSAFALLLEALRENSEALVCSGWPLKDIAKKEQPSLLDRFSLRVSAGERNPNIISGGLYAARIEPLRHIWMPVPTPGEDGFLNAMIHTHRFMEPANPHRVCRAPVPTHYFEAHSINGFVKHEARMIVGTVINNWIFEQCMDWAKSGEDPALRVRMLNETEPEWVDGIVKERLKKRGASPVPSKIALKRMHALRAMSFAKAVGRFPLALAATLVGLPPYLKANGILRGKRPSTFW